MRGKTVAAQPPSVQHVHFRLVLMGRSRSRGLLIRASLLAVSAVAVLAALEGLLGRPPHVSDVAVDVVVEQQLPHQLLLLLLLHCLVADGVSVGLNLLEDVLDDGGLGVLTGGGNGVAGGGDGGDGGGDGGGSDGGGGVGGGGVSGAVGEAGGVAVSGVREAVASGGQTGVELALGGGEDDGENDLQREWRIQLKGIFQKPPIRSG